MSLVSSNQPIIKTLFDDQTEIQIYEKANSRFIPLNRLGEVIYPTNYKHIHNLFNNRIDELEKYTRVDKVSTFTSSGEFHGLRETRLINFKGIIRVLMLAETPEAIRFRDFATEHLAELMLKGSTQIKNFDKFRQQLKLEFKKHDDRLVDLEKEKSFFAMEIKDLRTKTVSIIQELKDTKRKVSELQSEVIDAAKADKLKDEVYKLAQKVSHTLNVPVDRSLLFSCWGFLKQELIKRGLIKNQYAKYRYFTNEQYNMSLKILEWGQEEFNVLYYLANGGKTPNYVKSWKGGH